ncbi:MAG: hypothetical protein ACHREM_21985 [Polyangiales bacterium]
MARRAWTALAGAAGAMTVGLIGCVQLLDLRVGTLGDAGLDAAAPADSRAAADTASQDALDAADAVDATSSDAADADVTIAEASESGPDADGSIDALDAADSADAATTGCDPDASVACTGILYVSAATGVDTASGCTPCLPKKSIAAAIAAAKAGSSAHEIRVCAGTYVEHALVLDAPISVRGGYDCTTWTRTATYGAPTFDGAHETIVQNADVSVSRVTLDVNGASVDATVAIDGVTIEGAASGTAGSIGVQIRGGATPVLTNDRLRGGGASNTDAATNPWFASAAVFVTGGAGGELAKNDIDGGSGTTTVNANAGSAGIFAHYDAGTVSIHDNVIDGGTGSGVDWLSAGIFLWSSDGYTVANGFPIANNIIRGGHQPVSTIGAALSGVRSTHAKAVDFIGNQVVGGASYGYALDVSGNGPFRFVGNRLYGTDTTYGGGLNVSGDGVSHTQVEITNNLIHAGSKGGTALNTTAVDVEGSVALVMRHNTVALGKATEDGELMRLSTDDGATIENNVFVGAGYTEKLLTLVSCQATAGPVRAFRDNVVVNVGGPMLTYFSSVGAPCTPTTTMPTTLDGLVTELKTYASAVVQANLVLRTTCTSETGCVTSPCAGAACLFTGWSASDVGYTALFAGGWPFTAQVPCVVSKSALDDTSTVPTDLFGLTRTAPPSMGAIEDDGTCK